MRILLTGASSFTGYWFARYLHEHGHDVHAPLRARTAQTDPMRLRRIGGLPVRCHSYTYLDDVGSFGSDAFIALIKSLQPEIACLHHAQVTGYNRPDFDWHKALESNTRNAEAVMEALSESGCKRVIVTGSVFEHDEGKQLDHDVCRAFSPYGLSKGLTWQAFRFLAEQRGMLASKFVISNPFGPFEEPRFVSYLIRQWLANEAPTVKAPRYVRDNIHVRALAQAYVEFVTGEYTSALECWTDPSPLHCSPSGYVSTMEDFTAMLARAMAPRIKRACAYRIVEQTSFPEPVSRYGKTAVQHAWGDQESCWDELASFYLAEVA